MFFKIERLLKDELSKKHIDFDAVQKIVEANKDYINECDDGELYNVSSYDGVAVEDLYHKDPRYPSFVYEYGPSGIVVYEKIKEYISGGNK